MTISVVRAGAQTTVQDWPGRIGYWKVGVPPSGPMDDLSFRLANLAVGNAESATGLGHPDGTNAAVRGGIGRRGDRCTGARHGEWSRRSTVGADHRRRW